MLNARCSCRYTLGKTFTKFTDVACEVFEEDIQVTRHASPITQHTSRVTRHTQSLSTFFKSYLPAAGRVDKTFVPLTCAAPCAGVHVLLRVAVVGAVDAAAAVVVAIHRRHHQPPPPPHVSYTLDLMRAVPLKFDKSKMPKDDVDTLESNLKFGWAGLLSVVQVEGKSGCDCEGWFDACDCEGFFDAGCCRTCPLSSAMLC